MSGIDLLIGPIYLVFAYLILYLFRGTFTNKKTRPYFIPAFSAKVFGLCFFAIIYWFYYGGGDSFNFFQGGNILAYYLTSVPQVGFKGLLADANDITSPMHTYLSNIFFYRSSEEWAIIKIVAVCNLLSFRSYLGTGVFFALFCFLASWRLYTSLQKVYPEISKRLAWATLFVPSMIFWGSSVMKDTLTLAACSFIFAIIIDFAYKRSAIVRDTIILLISVKLLLALKIYLLFAMLPALGLWLFISFQSKIKSTAVKALIIPFLIVIIGVFAYGSVLYIASQNAEFASTDAVSNKLQTYHNYHGSLGGSAYSLGEVEYTPLGLLKKAPASIFVSLFRPFIFEVRNPVMLLSGFESTIYLLLTLYVLYKTGIRRTLRYTFSQPIMIFSIGFTLILGFIIGISSYNFGALVRFKIPFLPLYGLWLTLVYYMPRYELRDKKRLFAIKKAKNQALEALKSK